MKLPVQTADIYKELTKGHFISSNGLNSKSVKLYEIIDSHYEALCNYFLYIGLTLEKGDGYFYFSRYESKTDIENKVVAACKWIDILDFLKGFDPAFGPGKLFTPYELGQAVSTQASLQTKIKGLKKYTTRQKGRHSDVIEYIIKELEDGTFTELVNEVGGEYKVLSAFDYLEQLISLIHINETADNEIPEQSYSDK